MRGIVIFAILLAAITAAPPKVRSPKPQLDGRIVGGQPVNITQHPYQASFLFFGSHMCGGAIISNAWIATAGHCAEGASLSGVTFRVGSSLHNSGGQVSLATSLVLHPLYDGWNIDYDIALAHLTVLLTLTPEVQPITLPQVGSDWVGGTPATVSGWGATVEGGPISPNLQAVNVPIVGIAQCRAVYGYNAITERMLCAGLQQGGADACQGDSGGPLTVYETPVLAGLVSWGQGCARPNYPGVYAHIGYLRYFITQTTGI